MDGNPEAMNFINHTQPGSLDSGDALTCISTGVEVARLLLRALDADTSMSSSSKTAFGAEAKKLRGWMTAAHRLLDATSDQENYTLDIGSEEGEEA